MRVACVLIPRFPLLVELLARPELRGRAVVLGGAPEARKVVVECSSRAEHAGVRRGMPLREALTRCREAVFLEAHPALYADLFGRMLDALERVSPVVEGERFGCALVDLSGLPGVDARAGEVTLAEVMQLAVREAVGLRPRVGIAGDRFAAWVAASVPGTERAGDARGGMSTASLTTRVIEPGEAAAFLSPLPVDHLPLPEEMQGRLRRLGLRTIGELAALPRGALAAQFGPEGARAWELARGEGAAPPSPRRHAPSLSAQIAFTQPVVETAALEAAARQLLGRLLRRPECHGRAVRGLTLNAALSNGHRWQRRITFREPAGDRERMLRVIAARLDGAALPTAVEVLEIALHDLCGEGGVQPSLFSTHARLPRGVDGALEELHARFGRPLVMKIVGVEPWSRIPERQYALVPAETGGSASGRG